MTVIPEVQRVSKPEMGKALVIFARTTSFGGAVQSTIYDNDQYIGTISAKTHTAYQAAPGKHMFMIVGESADFMRADLVTGKTYYALVVPRMGVWKARFSLAPIDAAKETMQIKEIHEDTKQVKPNQEGYAWAKDNAASVGEKKAEYLPKWESKSDSDKQTLRPEYGK
jgi:hypothetical protein